MLDQPRDAVERDPAVVADDPAAAVGVGQSGQDVRAAAAPDVGGVGVEDAVVVRLAVLGERLDDVRIGLVAVGLQRGRDHAEAAVRHDGALERRVGLEADDDLVVAVDVARRVGGDRTRNLRDVEHALLALLDEQIRSASSRCPSCARSPGRGMPRRRRRACSSVWMKARTLISLCQSRPWKPCQGDVASWTCSCGAVAAMDTPLVPVLPASRHLPRLGAGFDQSQQHALCAGRLSVPRLSGSPTLRPGFLLERSAVLLPGSHPDPGRCRARQKPRRSGAGSRRSSRRCRR